MVPKKDGGSRQEKGSPAKMPLISIITVVFRARQDLPALLESVFRLKDENVEFIVVDGGSDDGTREFLREHNSRIDHWISEADLGIYDAMNKAIAMARGTFLLHLNAGDRLLSIPIEELKRLGPGSVDVAAFCVSIDEKFEFRPSVGLALRLNNTLHHQGTFFRREAFPLYDIRFKIFADFDVNQRLALRGARMVAFDQVVALHTTGGVSNVASRSAASEFFQVIRKNYGRHYLPAAWFLCKWRGLRSRLGRII